MELDSIQLKKLQIDRAYGALIIHGTQNKRADYLSYFHPVKSSDGDLTTRTYHHQKTHSSFQGLSAPYGAVLFVVFVPGKVSKPR
jgi:hypothetical protein